MTIIASESSFELLMDQGGVIVGYGNTITAEDWQILGHENNRAICPPEEKWIGYKTIPFPHPTFIRLPEMPAAAPPIYCEPTRTERVFGVLLAVVIGIALAAITFHGLSGGFR